MLTGRPLDPDYLIIGGALMFIAVAILIPGLIDAIRRGPRGPRQGGARR